MLQNNKLKNRFLQRRENTKLHEKFVRAASNIQNFWKSRVSSKNLIKKKTTVLTKEKAALSKFNFKNFSK